MPKYSIIVPVYNMSALLPKCIDSLRAQEYDDMEIVLVDDASTDNSYEICKEAEGLDNRIKVIQQDRNRGLSSTRNLGISYARGEYLTFVDADDYVEPDFIHAVEKVQDTFTYDMIAWGMFDDVVYRDGRVECSLSNLNYPVEKSVRNASEEDWTDLIMHSFFASACLRFYKTSIIQTNNLRFNTQCVDFEDYVFNITYCRYAESFLILDKAFYHYRQPAGQIATLKRKWGTVAPFQVSNIVYSATSEFFKEKAYSGENTKSIYFYVYKAYSNEIEYAYRTLGYRNFRQRAMSLLMDHGYLDTLEQLVSTNIGKYVKLILLLRQLHFNGLFAWLLWYMEYRTLGKQ